MKDICIITSSRADFGIISGLVSKISISKFFKLKLIVTGMHLSNEYGLTVKEIEKNGFKIHKKIEMLFSSDTPSAITKSIGAGLFGFADLFNDLQTDFVVLTGDRFEMLAVGISAMVARLPIVHIGGGEVTYGAFDEAIRHSLTKISHLHFVSTESYRKRVIQLGESPNRVFNVGSLSVENINEIKLLNKFQLEDKINFQFGSKNIIVTYHPVTLEINSEKKQFSKILKALDDLSDIKVIFTAPNADTNRGIINEMISDFVSENNERSISFTSMGYINYLSALQIVDGVVGNSSSGITEVPSFKIGTVNIGDRQAGRQRAESIIDCQADEESIKNSIKQFYDDDFKEKLETVKNPYEGVNTTKKIINVLRHHNGFEYIKKEFYDL